MATKATAKKETPKVKGKAVKEVEEKAPVKAAKTAKAAQKKEAPVKAAKAAEKAPAKAAKGKAAEKAPRGRGRVAGVRNEVTKKDAETLQNHFTAFENECDAFTDNVNKLMQSGNKVSASKARKNLQNIIRMSKEFRKSLQDAKVNMKQVKI
jgi:Tfp pilus assembly major pilin PilA